MTQDISDQTDCFQDSNVCPYFDDKRISTTEYLIPGEKEIEHFHIFLANGYRRIGRVFYRNACQNCTECQPLRIETKNFIMSRSHKRTVRKNEDVGMDILNQPFITPEKVVLYDRYVKSKHRESTVEESAEALNVLLNIHYGYPHTIEMDYFREGQLIGVGIVDEGRDALSSNYFYYDTDYLDRRLGVFSILKEIELAKILGKKYYYLGFFIEENPKMSYKKYFRPNETLKNGVWRDFLK